MSDNIIRKFTPEEAEAQRQAYYKDVLIPKFNKVFEAAPSLNSVILYVAQYWSDEALDAVHGKLVWSLEATPDLGTFHARVEAEAKQGLDDWDVWSFVEGRAAIDTIPDQVRDKYGAIPWDWYYASWDDNDEAIPLFSAFCVDMWHQEYGVFTEAYRPMLSFRRGDNTPEFIGEKYRPWLDGVASAHSLEQDDLDWDIYSTGVLNAFEKQERAAPGSQVDMAQSPASPLKRPGFFARLFGLGQKH